ncbi:uncharacterized LOC100207207 isoform X1 [Hydra vulgaris]|uniref:uncharacterized LOC100207207 isoform X1 n=1 Tax=Hydra vulgaris TaxID=6087 RepID=UPI0001927404|nr:uncharacterized LOC100207207 isoform X1 [Hydra vulgaris]
MTNKRKFVREEKVEADSDKIGNVEDEVPKQLEETDHNLSTDLDKPLSSLTSESIINHVQSIIDDMEVKRKDDETLIVEFRKSMEIQTEIWCDLLEKTLAKVYMKNNNTCQEKFQQLHTILGRISQLEQEMSSFKQSLNSLYAEVQATYPSLQ